MMMHIMAKRVILSIVAAGAALSMRAQDLPDLTPTALNSPGSAATGQSLTLTNWLVNAGAGSTGPWRYRVIQQ